MSIRCVFATPVGALKRRHAGFTLVEMLVATAVLLAIMGICFTIIEGTNSIWKNTTGKIEAFRNARAAFDELTRTLSQATLNTYYDYVDASGNFTSQPGSGYSGTPVAYGRRSDLQIISGPGGTLLPGITPYTAVTHAIFFQAPLGQVTSANSSVTSSSAMGGLNSLLNTCGFYVAYGPDPSVPTFLSSVYPSRNRYRLMQFTQPSDLLAIYGNQGTNNWFLNPIVSDLATSSATENAVLAENIIALVILPKLPSNDEAALNLSSVPLGTALAPAYAYDSTQKGQATVNAYLNSLHQLPPVIQVTMVAIDESSSLKMSNTTTAPNAALGLTSSLFTHAANLSSDLTSLENSLTAGHVNFRVFQTEVAIRGAKWTSN